MSDATGQQQKSYRGFVYDVSPTSFTVVSEKDKKFHIISRTGDEPIPNLVTVEEDHLVHIQKPYFNDPSRFFTACREYCYDTERKEKRRVRMVQEKREARQKQLEEREQKGIIKWGKFKNATYEDVMQFEPAYCEYILKKKTFTEEMSKFKDYLDKHFKKNALN